MFDGAYVHCICLGYSYHSHGAHGEAHLDNEGTQLVCFSAGKKFNSATAFSMHCKRQQTPNKQGDDGWKSVQYEGTQLDVFRRKFMQSSAEEAEV